MFVCVYHHSDSLIELYLQAVMMVKIFLKVSYWTYMTEYSW